MANEIQVHSALNITLAPGSTSQQYRSQPTTMTDDVETVAGPVPGYQVIGTTPETIDLSALGVGVDPGWCRIQNLDITNFVLVGIWDGAAFLPMIELEAEQWVVMKLYRDLGKEFSGTGSSSPGNLLAMMANTAECKVKIEVYGR